MYFLVTSVKVFFQRLELPIKVSLDLNLLLIVHYVSHDRVVTKYRWSEEYTHHK
jgi:hypothetical protein